MAGNKDEVSFEIVEEIAELFPKGSWYMELNKVKWNGGEAKLDIRPWDEVHEKCGKGLTFTDEEGKKVRDALIAYYADKE